MARSTYKIDTDQHNDRMAPKALVADFLEKTEIRIFSLMQDSYTKFEKACWLVVFLALIAATLKDCCQMFTTYATQPKGAKVSMSDKRSKLEFPAPTLCFDLFPENIPSIDQAYSANLSAHESELIKVINSSEPASDEAHGIVAKLVLDNAQLESGCGGLDSKKYAGSWANYSASFDPPISLEFQRRVLEILERSVNQSASSFLTTAVQKSGAWLCRKMALAVHEGDYSKSVQMNARNISACDEANVAWLGEAPFSLCGNEQLCLRLHNYTMTFRNAATKLVVTHRPNALHEKLTGKGYMIVDLSGRMGADVVSNTLWAPYGLNVHGGVVVKAEYKLADCPSGPEQDYLSCEGACRIGWIERYCGCSPLSWSVAKPTSKAVCANFSGDQPEALAAMNSTECLRAAFDARPDGECSRGCRSCNIMDIVVNALTLNVSVELSKLLLYSDTYTYPVFEECQLIDPVTVFSNIGGIIAIWLGISICGLLHLAIFGLKMIFGAVKYSRSIKPDSSVACVKLAAPEWNCEEPRIDRANIAELQTAFCK